MLRPDLNISEILSGTQEGSKLKSVGLRKNSVSGK